MSIAGEIMNTGGRIISIVVTVLEWIFFVGGIIAISIIFSNLGKRLREVKEERRRRKEFEKEVEELKNG